MIAIIEVVIGFLIGFVITNFILRYRKVDTSYSIEHVERIARILERTKEKNCVNCNKVIRKTCPLGMCMICSIQHNLAKEVLKLKEREGKE